MKLTLIERMTYVVAAIIFANSLWAQASASGTTPSSSSTPSSTASPAAASSAAAPAAAAAGGGTGTYSIEAEIFAYKSLQANSSGIASDLIPLLGTGCRGPDKTPETCGVVMVPSVSATLPAFQVWRSNMVVTQNFLSQFGTGQFSCPEAPSRGAPSFSAYATAASEGIGVIQSILALFSNSETVSEFTGTIQDQALMTALSRQLRAKNIKVLTPDVFAPWTIADIGKTNFPFVGRLSKLVEDHGELQRYYQCNALAVSASSQLQQAEIAREADYAVLAATPPTDKDKIQSILGAISNLHSQINFLRGKIGLDPQNKAILDAENRIQDDELKLADASSSAAQKRTALNEIYAQDAANSALENDRIIAETLQMTKAQALLTGIESYLAGLTGGAINFTPPSATSPSPTSASPSTSPGATGAASVAGGAASTPAAAAASTTPTTSASPTLSASSATSATPPILTILQADGLARRMGFKVEDDGVNFNPDAWRVLWVKSLESGGAIITESNILGSHPHFGGGAVSGYALFNLDGTLICSGNAAAYGGYVKAKNFAKNPNAVAVTMLGLGGGCSNITSPTVPPSN